MTSEELLTKVENRLNRTDNPTLPPEETMRAILELGKEREDAIKEKLSMAEKVASLESRIENLNAQVEAAESKAEKAESKSKEQEWIAHELGKFVRDVANGLYAGQERAAANRVYDLNGGSITKKRLNCYTFDSLSEARRAYARTIPDSELLNLDAFEEWLFRFAS